MIQKMTFDIKSKEIVFNKAIIGHILNLSQKLPSNQHTNIGGWQYDFIVNGRPGPDWLNPIVSQIDRKIQRLWININGPGHYNEWHTHYHAKVGVIYLKVPLDSGDIEFRSYDEIYRITPQAGQFLIFPGSLEHRVLENKSNEFRISLAINLF